jgi:glycosyltransferase involved in cell wall biosynthesis
MRLKVALVSDWYLPHIGGVEYQMRDLAHELIRRGHEVDIVTATPGPTSLDGLRIHRLDVPIIHHYGIVWNRQGLAPLEQLLLQERYDVVHGHGLY